MAAPRKISAGLPNVPGDQAGSGRRIADHFRVKHKLQVASLGQFCEGYRQRLWYPLDSNLRQSCRLQGRRGGVHDSDRARRNCSSFWEHQAAISCRQSRSANGGVCAKADMEARDGKPGGDFLLPAASWFRGIERETRYMRRRKAGAAGLQSCAMVFKNRRRQSRRSKQRRDANQTIARGEIED